jgi:hypothetical protein
MVNGGFAMDEDFMARLDSEEAALEAKLAAVRQLKLVYGFKGAAIAVKQAASVRPAPTVRPARSFVDRIDKFGPYGKSVIEAATKFLPDETGHPVPTRDLVEKIEILDIDIRGENKVNALSALLARSSKIKGHGRAGWTLATPKSHDDNQLQGGAAHNAIEAPNGDAVSASIVADQGAPTPGSAAWINPNPGWTS